jgi:uncharacterized membrane protein
MKTKFKVYLLAAAINALAMALVTAGIQAQTVPIHFNYAGEADSWASKWVYLIFAAIPLAEIASYKLYRRANRDNEAVKKNAAIEERVVALTGLFLAAMGWFFLLVVRSGETKLNTSFACLIFTGVGLLMIYISNYMAKIRPNHTLGFRVKWTLRDETVWIRTHRVSGYTGVVGGVIIILGSLLGLALDVWMSFAGFALGMIVMVGIPTVYARNLYHQLHPDGK